MRPDWFASLCQNPLFLPASARAANGGAQLLAILAEYQRTEQLSYTALVEQQSLLLQALAQHAARQSRHFASRLRSASLRPEALAAPGGLSRLPPLTRRQLVDAGGALFWNDEPINEAGLQAQLLVAAQKHPQPELQIKADRTTKYQEVATVMADAKNANMEKIGFIAPSQGQQ